MYSPQEVAFIALFAFTFGCLMGYILHNAIEAHEIERQLLKKEQRQPMATRTKS